MLRTLRTTNPEFVARLQDGFFSELPHEQARFKALFSQKERLESSPPLREFSSAWARNR
jgi:hypothetical protein